MYLRPRLLNLIVARAVTTKFSGEASVNEVETAINGHIEQIRHIQPGVANGLLLAEVTKLAKEYGARQDIEQSVLVEAVQFVVASFPWLGVREIRTAFRWHASGKIDTSAGEMYGGIFTVRVLGAILTGYNETRKKIIAEYMDAVTKEEQDKEEQVRREEQKANFEKNLISSVSRARAQKLPWKSIPVDWHDWLLERGILTYTEEEKQQVWKDAKIEVEIEKEEAMRQAMTGDKMNRKTSLKAIGAQDDAVRRVILAKKLLVYRKKIKG